MQGAGRGQRALLVDDLPGAGQGGRKAGDRHQTQGRHGTPEMEHRPESAEFADRVLERQPEDLALRDTGIHRAEQGQPCVHTADPNVLLTRKAVRHRNSTVTPRRRRRGRLGPSTAVCVNVIDEASGNRRQDGTAPAAVTKI